jgi:hypothetical protein
MSLECKQFRSANLWVKIVAGQLGTIDSLISTVVDKIVHVDLFGIRGTVLHMRGGSEMIAKAIRGKAQSKSRLAFALY